MSFDFVRKLSPRLHARALEGGGGGNSQPQPSTRMPPSHITISEPITIKPKGTSAPSSLTVVSPPTSTASDRSPTLSPARSPRLPSPARSRMASSSDSTRPSESSDSSCPPCSSPLVRHSPVSLLPHVDPRYPDMIATLSNALHYLNKSGFDHDRDHHHDGNSKCEGDDKDKESSSTNDSSYFSSEPDQFAVRVEDNEQTWTAEADAEVDVLLTPGCSDSDEESEDPEELERARSAGYHPSGHHHSSHHHSSHHHAHHAEKHHHGESADFAAQQARMEEGAKGFQQSHQPVLPQEFPEVPAVSPPVPVEREGGELRAPLSPKDWSSEPGHARTYPSSKSADLVPSQSPPAEAVTSPASPPPLGAASSAMSSSPESLSAASQASKVNGEPIKARDPAVMRIKGARHQRAHSDAQYLTPAAHNDTRSPNPPKSPRSPVSPASPSPAFSPPSLSPSSAFITEPAHVDAQESTKTETTESCTETETDEAKTITTTTITTITTVLTRTEVNTTIIPKFKSPDPTIDWTPTEQSQLLEEILIFYVDLYWENQQSFAPFYKQSTATWHDKALMIYRHLFQDDKFKSQTKRFLKEPLVDFFEEQLLKKAGVGKGLTGKTNVQDSIGSPSSEQFNLYDSPHGTGPEGSSGGTPSQQARSLMGIDDRRKSFSLPNPLALFTGSKDSREPTRDELEMENYLTRLNAVAQDLHKLFVECSNTINESLVQHILDPAILPTVSSANEINRTMISHVHDPKILKTLSVYHCAYQDAVVGFPGRILMSRTLRHRIESGTFQLFNFTDLIIAVNELTEILRKCFQKLATHHPHMIQRLVHSQRLQSLRDLHIEARMEREKKRDKGGYAESFSSWLYDSRVYPKLFTDRTYQILKELQTQDAKTFRMVSEHRLQEALWRLKDLNLDETADKLELIMEREILNDHQANVSQVENLGGGFTTTKLINFPTTDVRGVYKPKSDLSLEHGMPSLQQVKDSMVSNYKKEIAAYRIDRLLKLNHVPLTKVTQYHGNKGSLQYFIQDANVARVVNDVDFSNPTKSGKWTNPRGRAELPRSIKMFDWLINNRDRNLDNYLISDDGRAVLIDHGWTFIAPTTAPTKDFLKKLIPKESIFKQVKALHENQKLIDDELKDLLGPRNLNAFKGRLRTFVHFVEKRIAKKGREATFREAEEHDWKPDLS